MKILAVTYNLRCYLKKLISIIGKNEEMYPKLTIF